MLSAAELEVFSVLPDALPLYEAVSAKLEAAFPDAKKKVSRTQVGYATRYGFAFLWPPVRRIKGRAGVYIVLSFGLDHRLDSPRIVEAANPSRRRWTHHVIIERADEVDDEVMGWLREAYEFSHWGVRGGPHG